MSSTEPPPETETEIRAKKTRKRPRKTQIRHDIKQILETAIMDQKRQSLSLFQKNTERQVYEANLHTVLRALIRDPTMLQKALALSTFALKSIERQTKLFAVVGDDKAAPDSLKLEFSTLLPTKVSDTIAYVDNLPLLCTAQSLQRRASVFGTVLAVHLPPPRLVGQRHAMIRGGIRPQHAGYGFVQFASAHSVKRFCWRYAANSHLRRHARSRRRRARQRQMRVEEPMVPVEGSGVFEWSGLESGLESEAEPVLKLPIRRRIRRRTFNESVCESEIQAMEVVEAPKKEKKRIRRKRSLWSSPFSLRFLFRSIQVFTLKRYRHLKKIYYEKKRQAGSCQRAIVRPTF